MKVSDLLNVLNDSKIIIETEITLFGFSRKVTVIEGSYKNVIKRCSAELLEAEVRSMMVTGAGLLVSVL